MFNLSQLGNYHPNVLGIIEVLQDDEFLYAVVPFCSGGDFYRRIARDVVNTSDFSEESSSQTSAEALPMRRLDEEAARPWFRQILSVS